MKRLSLQDSILRKDRAIFLLIALVCLLTALGGVIYVLCVWRDIPPDVGYHFGANGEFDIYGSKQIAFWHPFIAQAVILVVFTLLGSLCYLIKPLHCLSPTGHRLVTCATAHWCNLCTLEWIVFFVYWEWCVVTQTSMNTDVGRGLFFTLIAAFGAVLALFVVALIRFKKKAPVETKNHSGEINI